MTMNTTSANFRILGSTWYAAAIISWRWFSSVWMVEQTDKAAGLAFRQLGGSFASVISIVFTQHQHAFGSDGSLAIGGNRHRWVDWNMTFLSELSQSLAWSALVYGADESPSSLLLLHPPPPSANHKTPVNIATIRPAASLSRLVGVV